MNKGHIAAIAYTILVRALIALHGKDSLLGAAMGRDFKGKVSLVIYVVAVLLTLINSWLAFALYILVAIMWLVPDPRIEKTMVRRDM